MEKYQKYMPNNRFLRIIVGILFILMGIVGFLPIVGFWMIPVGLIILSVDFAFIRRFRRRQAVKWGRWWQDRKARRQK